jgi:hypothetical protein
MKITLKQVLLAITFIGVLSGANNSEARVTLKGSLGPGFSTQTPFDLPGKEILKKDELSKMIYPGGRFLFESSFYLNNYLAATLDGGMFYYYIQDMNIIRGALLNHLYDKRVDVKDGESLKDFLIRNESTINLLYGFLTAPINIGAKFNLAPFGPINPYVSAGYNWSFAYAIDSFLDLYSATGPFGGFGVEMVTKDKIIYSLDVRWNFTTHKAIFKNPLISNEVESSFNAWPITITAGIGIEL